jgi:hypothetical protein
MRGDRRLQLRGRTALRGVVRVKSVTTRAVIDAAAL